MKTKITYNILLFINLLWIFSGLWLSHDSLKKLTALAIIFLVFSLISNPKVIIANIKKKHNIFIFILVILSLYAKYFHGGIFGSFTRSCLILYMIAISLNTEKTNITLLKHSITLGFLLNLGFLVYIRVFLQESRPENFMNPNIYAPVFGLFFIYFCYSTLKHHNIVDLILSILAIYCVSIMQSRGVIVASVLSLSIVLIHSTYIVSKNKIIRSLVLLIPIIFMIILLNSKLGEKLYEKSTHEYNQIKNGNLNTSIGLRIEMAYIAKDLILEKPLAGYGDDFTSARKEIIKKNDYNPIINKFKTLHNVYSDSWAKLGLLGFISSLLLTLLPILLLIKTPNIILGLSLTIFTFTISMVDTALLGGEYLLMLIALSYIYRCLSDLSK